MDRMDPARLGQSRIGFSMDATTLASWIGDARQELVFEGDVTMDPTALRAALDVSADGI